MTINPTQHGLAKRGVGENRDRRSSDASDPGRLSQLAKAMMREFAADAAGAALARADAALDVGDGEGFQTWLDVAGAIQEFIALALGSEGAVPKREGADLAQNNA